MKFSQNNEDEIIAEYFQDKVGTFLDIGANDGETLSNTRALALKGWYGLLVEPSVEAFSRLEKLYPDGKQQLFNYAVGPKNEVVTFYESGSHLKKGDHALLSTTLESELKRWKGKEEFVKTEVKMITPRMMMEYSILKHFDFISIDAEGLDVVILRQMLPFTAKTKMICVEYNNDPEVKQQIINLLPEFKQYAINYENIIMVR